MDVTQTLVTVSLIALALLAAAMWWRHRSNTTAWVLWMFLALAMGRAVGELLPADPTGPAALLARVPGLAILMFPYLLLRFAASLEPVGRRAEALAGAATGAVLLTSALMPRPAAGAPDPAWYQLYVAAALTYWTMLSGWVVWRLWRAGGRQPSVIRRRMWTLAAGAASLNIALIIVGVDPTGAFTGLVEVVAFASAILFFLGFAPPRWVRLLWRRPDEQALWRVERDLVAATTRDEVVSYMLPRVSWLLGGEGAVFIDRKGSVATDGAPSRRIEHVRRQMADAEPATTEPTLADGVVVVEMHEGRLGIVASPYTPLFGQDELELIKGLGTLIDLALSRTELYDRERRARGRAESLREELEALVYGLSHDLRSPIVSVLGYVECLIEDHSHLLDEEGRHFLSRLHSNTTYMDELISDLLELSRVGRLPDDPEPVELGELCEHIAKELHAAHPSASLEIESLPTVSLDNARARQLMTNLIVNAVIHSGRPDVTVRVLAHEPQRPGWACLAVADNGKGIPADYRDRVFGIFEQLSATSGNDQPTSGIGLAISRKIVEQADGRIWVADSKVGADIRVELPLASSAPGPEAAR